MEAGPPVYQYVTFDPALLFDQQALIPLGISAIEGKLWDLLRGTGISHDDYVIDTFPLVRFYGGQSDREPAPTPPHVPQKVFSVRSPSPSAADNVRRAINSLPGSGLQSIVANPALTSTEVSIPASPDAAVFGTIDDARRLINAGQIPANYDGTSVNVVVIDAGIDQSMFQNPAQFGGGWQPLPQGAGLPTPPLPGATTGAAALHGTMIVNDILAMAPNATIFDVPLIPPPKIFDIFSFLVAADAAYDAILSGIQWYRSQGKYMGPWIFMNAWGIYDRRSEGQYLGEYTENLGPNMNGVPPHPFIQRIQNVAAANFDIVFCAGNCGEVCPDDRCGPNDYGPGRSIWGANAHRDVLTAGGVRVDGIWCGYSSEGPGPTPHLYAQKPDLCAPTQFVGSGGRYPPNDGTSAAAAMTAGIVCALRTRANWNQTAIPPFILKLILNATAMQTQGLGWNRWLGNGILNAGAAYQQLLASYP